VLLLKVISRIRRACERWYVL